MAQKKKIDHKESIIVRGARTHNLKNISVEIPRGKMTVITGVSGSGKSSLAFDTIFAEGQRRYVESLSAYARQFLGQMPKPDVDEISGLSPAISIDQKSRSNNPRSTVATITEIYDYLRVLYARIGHPHCPDCGKQIKKLTNEEILNFALDRVKEFEKNHKNDKKILGVSWNETELHIFAPVVRGRKGEYYQLLYDLLGRGFEYVRIDGKVLKLREKIILSKNNVHTIEVLVDTLFVHEFKDNSEDAKMRLYEAIERSLIEADGLVTLSFKSDKPLPTSPYQGRSPKSPPDKGDLGGFEDTEFLLSSKFACPHDGYSFPEIEPRLFSFNSPYGACTECNGLGTTIFMGDDICTVCNGKRLRVEALHVFLKSSHKKFNIVDYVGLSIRESLDFIQNLDLTDQEFDIAQIVLREIEYRLQFLLDVGLEYLSLSRKANTLSGGESQRIRLASQLGSRLVGALYVLDEPTIGLHQRDNEKLIKTLTDLRDLGNTILVVEHDEDTIFSADYIIDIGPHAGVHGGQVVAYGDMEELISQKTPPFKGASRTLAYLRGEISIPVPEDRRVKDKGKLNIVGGHIFNIKNMNVEIPLGKMVCITGVSGSGKSSLMYEIIHKNLQARLERRNRSAKTYNCASFTGSEFLSRVVLIDQSPIGRTPRSNIATYTGAWTFVRDLFASSEQARLRGWKANRFSFNVKGGRCEACEGNGQIAVEMHFLPTVYVTCDVCNGRRFDKETLSVKYKKKNIYDVLETTIEEAITFFEEIPQIYDRLKTLMDVGLGYLKLGQSATTLSGGEAQRVKISSELFKPHVEKTIYLLDEPTVGLHYDDVAKLLDVLNKLINRGHSVMLIEHSMDIIKSSDYIIDIGPEGGTGGGNLVAKGTPEEIANNTKSYTGKYLKKALRRK
ncbi:excinuclease ABC subunit A [Candidatus Nomurabacteria bacterium RIFCSPHIGHO2_02_FULL_33_12]|uniref:UvrABC system protein A n=1 Tax=Candidatus Nomurabacteria bacterium RIFCSPLOWO2_01_FULL_33_17 TaxID=1801764 RepID=A0A1F6WMQ5_9BACT|nr:MAG: excinuclease ABC subunit A [Candidatus Nomurabacteria bacterium RIFCSPHIGHO2_02_FULL_33_12]OGI83158.1 MAG: excinuclease ABC subunit A [Candidatus Nomurabacteria bacterium RIFCSPLOWO2_01_FULL_33_17]